MLKRNILFLVFIAFILNLGATPQKRCKRPNCSFCGMPIPFTEKTEFSYLRDLKDRVEDGDFEVFRLALEAADIGTHSKVRSINRISQEIFKVLFENLNIFVSQGEYFNEAIELARVGMKCRHIGIIGLVPKLFETLFDKDQGFEEAIEVAVVGVQSHDRDSRMLALALFDTLFKKGQGVKEAIEWASVSMECGNFNTLTVALHLFKILFDNGQGFEEAIELAGVCMKSNDLGIRRSALALFKALVNKGKGFKEAIELAGDCMRSDNSGTRRCALGLFEILFNEGKGFKEAIKLGASGRNRGKKTVRQDYEKLFRALPYSFERLVKNGKCFKEAIELAKMLIKYSYLDTLSLFKALFEQSQGFEEAIELMQGGSHGDYGLGRAFQLLFNVLAQELVPMVNDGLYIEEAIKAIAVSKQYVANWYFGDFQDNKFRCSRQKLSRALANQGH